MPLVALWTHAWEIWNTPEMPVERMENRRKRVLRDWKNSRMIHCTYCNHTTTSPLNTTYRYFYNEWRTVPSSRPNFKAVEAMTGEAARKNNSAQICYGSASYRDWYCYHLDKNLRHWRGEDPQVPVGLYFDTSGPTTCANAHHDHGVVIDGERKPYLAILTWRELSKRLRTIIKAVDPDAWLTVHMSGRPVPAYWGFYDIMIPGEQYAAFFTFKKAQAEAAGKPWPYDYTVMTQLDRVRAEYSSQGFGPAQVFLSEIWNFARGIPEAEQLPALRHLVGLLFVNDIRTWGGGRVELEVLEALWRHFGWDDEIVFHPYWRNQALIQPVPYDENRLVASLFTRRGRAFLFPFNNTDEAVEMAFDLRLEAVGVGGYAGGFLWDPLGGQRFPLTGTRVTVPVPPRDFRLLLLLPPGTDTASLTAP